METFEFKLPISLRTEDPIVVDPAVVVEPVVTTPVIEPDPLATVIAPVVIPVVASVIVPDPPEEIDLLGDTVIPPTDELVDEFEFAATELGLTLPEGSEKWDSKLIASQAKLKIEESRQVLNLDDYDPEVKTLFKYIQENGGSMIGLATDPVIKDLNELTMYDAEVFFRISMSVKLRDAGLSESSIENQIDVLIEEIEEENREGYFEKYKTDKIRSDINPLINERVEELNKEKESYRSRLKLIQDGASEKVNKRMEQVVTDLTDMIGIEFSTKNKESVIAGLKNGSIQKEIAKDPGYYQMKGYLHDKSDPKLLEIWKDLLVNQGKSKYHEGVNKVLNHAYNSDKDKGGSSSSSDKIVVNDWKKLGTR